MLASCSFGLLLLLLSTIQTCQELIVSQSLCFLFHMHHQKSCVTAMKVRNREIPTPLAENNSAHNCWSLCLKYVKLQSVCPPLFTPPSFIHSADSPSLPPPASIPLSLSLSHSVSTPTEAYQPPFAFRQHLLLVHAFHLSYPGHVTPPPLHPVPVLVGAGCSVLGVRVRPDKLRFRRAEYEGEGQQRQS